MRKQVVFTEDEYDAVVTLVRDALNAVERMESSYLKTEAKYRLSETLTYLKGENEEEGREL